MYTVQPCIQSNYMYIYSLTIYMYMYMYDKINAYTRLNENWTLTF